MKKMTKRPHTLVIVGAQWGDEGKGKVTDYYAQNADYVVRFQGGNNAGHTVVYKGVTYKFHLLPSGVLHQGIKIIIGNGTVIDPKVFFNELETVRGFGFRPQVLVSERAHIIFPFQIMLDAAHEDDTAARSLSALSTRRGIWPTYADKAARVGIRVVDLINADIFKQKFDLLFDIQKKRLEMIYGMSRPMNKAAMFREYLEYGKKLAPLATDVSLELTVALAKGKRVLFEGSQGACLDVDYGVYPYTTSSNTTAGAVCTGVGIGPQEVGDVMGVVKAYVSRVGGGHLPTELKDGVGDWIREKGAEYGTTTGRARRIGWLDLVQLRLAKRINGLRSIAVTKIDVLGSLPTIKVCTAYRVGSRILTEMPADLSVYAKCRPVYTTLKGWPELHPDEKAIIVKKGFAALPATMRTYIQFIEHELKLPAEMVSIGADREATIMR